MKKIITTLVLSFSFIMPGIAYGQGGIAGQIDSFYTSALTIGGILAVVMIVVGAIYFSVSGGSPDRKSEGKDYITSAIWGLVLLVGAFLILNTVNPELTNLTNPAGPVVTGFSCEANPGVNECGENQEPSYDSEGNLTCCTNFETSNGGAECPTEVYEGCSSEKIVVGGENPNTPYCADGTPVCQIDVQTGNPSVPYCNQGSGESPGPQCNEGLAQCNDDGRIYCTGSDGVGVEGGETISVPDCITGCENDLQTKQITIQPGGEYKQQPYFPENSSSSQATCVNYAYKRGPTYGYEYADVYGLRYCR